MPDIKIVLFLVRCSQSLLYCDEIDTDRLSFADMPACQAEVPRLIETTKRASPTDYVFMGRCHYLTKSPQPKTGNIAAGGNMPAPAEVSAALRQGDP